MQVLESLPPKDGPLQGIENMLAAVIKNAKTKAAEGIALSAAADYSKHDGAVCG